MPSEVMIVLSPKELEGVNLKQVIYCNCLYLFGMCLSHKTDSSGCVCVCVCDVCALHVRVLAKMRMQCFYEHKIHCWVVFSH